MEFFVWPFLNEGALANRAVGFITVLDMLNCYYLAADH